MRSLNEAANARAAAMPSARRLMSARARQASSMFGAMAVAASNSCCSLFQLARLAQSLSQLVVSLGRVRG